MALNFGKIRATSPSLLRAMECVFCASPGEQLGCSSLRLRSRTGRERCFQRAPLPAQASGGFVKRLCADKLFALLTYMLLPCCSGGAWAIPSPLLTSEEQAWIHAHPVVRVVAETNWSPFEYLERGRIVGLIPSYMAAVSAMTGLHFEVDHSLGWGQSPEAFQSGKADVTAVISRTAAERLGPNVIVSRPFFVSAISIITDHQAAVMFDLQELKGQRVALKGQGGLEFLVRQAHPSIKVLPFDTHEEALEALANGEAEAALGLDATILPIMRRQFYGRLYLSGSVAYHPIALSLATRSDLPLLASIIDKSLAAIPVRQANGIRESWLRLADYGEPSTASILRYRAPQVLGALGIFIVFLVLTIYSIRARGVALRSEREKAMFLAFMSHEIRTPMHSIFSSLELLQRSPLNARQAERTRSAVVAAETLLELLNDLLEYSRLDSRRLELEQLATCMGMWAQQTVNLVRWRADEKGLTLALDMACDAELNLIIDPTRLRQIASNLLVNAIKFTESGTVKLRLEYAPALKANGAGELKLEVSDTGIGLSKAQQLHIFDAFQQADTSTTRQYGGTGLGLAICKELATLMRGTIAVSSERGGLTTFTIRIPALIAGSVASPDAEQFVKPPPRIHPALTCVDGDVVPAAGPTVLQCPLLLVVDDHVAVQIAIRDQLEELGCDAILLGTGTAALDVFGQTRFDMVLLDCNLPDIDGYTVAESMRKVESATNAAHTPIIAISAAVNDAHKLRCVSSGMDDVLSKPLRLDVLKALIERRCATFITGSRRVESNDVDQRETLQQAYQRTLDNDIDVILRAIEQNDWSRMRYAIHRIKGSSHVAGHDDIAEVAGMLEALLNSTPLPSPEVLANMLEHLNEARGFQR